VDNNLSYLKPKMGYRYKNLKKEKPKLLKNSKRNLYFVTIEKRGVLKINLKHSS